MNAWALARSLDPLPHRLSVELGPDDGGVLAAIVGATWCVSVSTDEGVAPWRALAHELTTGVARGIGLEARVAEVAQARRPGAGPVAAGTFRAWEEARHAVSELRAALAWPEQPDADAWLKWLHGRNTRGRTHHYSQLLLALTGRPSCLWSASGLARRLFERPSAPHDLDTMLRVQLDREELRALPDPTDHDVRGLPLARLLAAWLLLETETTQQSPQAWLEAASAQIRTVAASVWTDGLPVQRAVNDGERPMWTTRELVRRRKSADGPSGEEARLEPRERVGAAFAFALNQTADNFAVRVMPSLALWRTFWAALHPWMDAYPDIAPPGSEEAWLWQWRLVDGNGTPWSASRLFLHTSRAVQEERPAHLVARSLDRSHQAGRAALFALVDELVDDLGRTSVAKRARQREDGLRWQPAVLTDSAERSAWPAG